MSYIGSPRRRAFNVVAYNAQKAERESRYCKIDRSTLESLIGLVEAETNRMRSRPGQAVRAGVDMRDAVVTCAKQALNKNETERDDQ